MKNHERAEKNNRNDVDYHWHVKVASRNIAWKSGTGEQKNRHGLCTFPNMVICSNITEKSGKTRQIKIFSWVNWPISSCSNLHKILIPME